MKIRHLIIILTLGLLAYANTLWNGFVGDDNQLLVENTFYRSFENFHRLFLPESIIKEITYFSPENTDKGPINPSFRLMDKVSLFFDYASFGLHPWGYHLTNIAIHIFNALILYITLVQFIPITIAFYSAVLFSIHPIFGEAVSNISFRGDLLATLFVLLSFYGWVNFSKQLKNRGYYYVSLFFCLLAFLTKESTVVLPAIIWMYQRFFTKNKSATRFQIGFWLVLCLYLYIYFCLYPPSIWTQTKQQGLMGQTVLMINVFSEYLKSFFLPASIYPLPPRHTPVSNHLLEVLIVLMIATIFYSRKKFPELAFFIGWFIVFYLPISNIFPLINPMAYRFIYLPAIGLCVATVAVIHKILYSNSKYFQQSKLPVILSWIVGAFLIFPTKRFNAWFYSPVTLAYSWTKYYPQKSLGVFLFGT